MEIHFIGKQYGITQTQKQYQKGKARQRLKFLLTLFLSLFERLPFFRKTIKLIPAINQRENKKDEKSFVLQLRMNVGENR